MPRVFLVFCNRLPDKCVDEGSILFINVVFIWVSKMSDLVIKTVASQMYLMVSVIYKSWRAKLKIFENLFEKNWYNNY